MLFYAVALFVFAVDQGLKYLVSSKMVCNQSVAIWQGISLTYVKNTGGAFSLFLGCSPYLVVIGLAAVAAIIYFHTKVPRWNYYFQTALAFVLGGSLGNLFDRIAHASVIDYIDVGFWPVFNFADVMINLGVLLIVLELLKEGKESVSDPF